MAEAFRHGDEEKRPQECWKVTTTAEKVLLALLIGAVAALVALFVFVSYHFLYEQNCNTPKCIETSHALLQVLDPSASPCINFDRLICSHHVPIHEKGDQGKANLDFLSEDLHEDDDLLVTTMKTFYQVCLDEGDRTDTLHTLVSQIGGWPLLMGAEWNEDNFNWQNYMVEVRPWGVKSDWLLSFDYYRDENGTNLLLILPPRLEGFRIGLGGGYYQEVIGALAGRFESNNLLQGQLNQMVEFEGNLYEISKSARNDIVENGDYTQIPVSKINSLWPTSLLFENLNGLARGYAVFTNSTIVVVASENYLYELHKLLMAVPKRTQANYFVWKTIEGFLPFLSEDIREIYGKYVKLDDIEDQCYNETIKRFHSTIEQQNMGKYNKGKTTLLLEALVNLIYKSYNNSEDLQVVVDGPEGANSGVINISLKSKKLIRMMCQIEFHVENQFYHCLHRRSDCIKENYYDENQELELFFDTSNRTIHIPYTLIYGDSFKWDQPNYINFARLGRAIGDEIVEVEEERLNDTIEEIGVNLAYEGYMKWLQIEGMEDKLPVLNYTIKQLFWIHSGLKHCDDEEQIEEILESDHFKKDFRCT